MIIYPVTNFSLKTVKQSVCRFLTDILFEFPDKNIQTLSEFLTSCTNTVDLSQSPKYSDIFIRIPDEKFGARVFCFRIFQLITILFIFLSYVAVCQQFFRWKERTFAWQKIVRTLITITYFTLKKRIDRIRS